jgi:hypothetical protein
VSFVAEKSDIVFLRVPSPVTETSITSPGFKNTGGFFPMPTPAGVPVARTSPGCKVWPSESALIRKGMENMRSPVVAFCRSWPFTCV